MNSKLILLVDPEDDTLRLLRIILEKAGYHVLAAHNGAAGIRLVDEWIPILIFISVELAHAPEFISQIQSQPRFANTKLGQINWYGQKRIANAPFVIEKPIRFTQVLQEVSFAISN